MALEGFGFGRAEAAVYKALLASGTRPATIIARKAGLKRGQTYNILRAFVDQGLIQEFLKNGVRQFAPNPPTALITSIEHQKEELESRKQQLQDILPFLSDMQSRYTNDSRIRCYRGVEGIKEIYEDMIRAPDTTLYALIDITYDPIFSEGPNFRWINDFVSRRCERGIWWQAIANKSSGTDRALIDRRKGNRRIKMVHGMDLPFTIHAYRDRVALTSTHEEKVGFVVESEGVAETLRNAACAVWDFLPDYRVGECR